MQEWELTSETSIVLSGEIRIELPDFMTQVSQEEMDTIKKVPQNIRKFLLIAIGKDHNGDIVAIGACGDFFVFDGKNSTEKCSLIESGSKIKFGTSHVVDTYVLIENATKLPVKIEL